MKILKKIITISILLIFPIIVNAQNSGSFSGKVIDKLTQKPIPNSTIFLEGTSKVAVADSSGSFRITGIVLKTYNITFKNIGYKPVTLYNITINSGNENNVNVELEPTASLLSEVVVKSNKRTVEAATLETPLSVQRLTTEEIKTNPGGNFDISKVIQTLPGVGGGAGGGGFRNDIIIRGGGPNENVFYLDGIEVPVINHFQTQGSSGGPQGILNVSFIEDVKLSSSAFDARYDNALSSVFQFKQRTGNPNKVQGNVRLSATELATTFEGPLSKNKKTTFLASARRSYLQLLFSLIDLPIRPNYWDFQTKITHQIDEKTTLSFIGLGALDKFRFGEIKQATPEKLYIINSAPFIDQNTYTAGLTFKKLLNNGFLNIALSRNYFDNNINQFEDNKSQLPSQQILSVNSTEIENKLRIDINKNKNGWKISYGAMLQLAEYNNETFTVLRKELRDNNGNIIQPNVSLNFNSPLNNFLKYGAFMQLSKRFFDNRLGISGGLRTDMNSFTTNGDNPLETLSPRVSLSYVLADKWTANASIGSYFKIAPYTILGFADNNNSLVNKNSKYQKSDHYVTGIEYLPNDGLRFTVEGFYKNYNNVPVSVRNGISLTNLGNDFNVLGNEAVITNGKGNTYGLEFFAQKKLTDRFFGIFSYTYFRSKYSGANNVLISSSWDNRHLLSITSGYKFNRNWELGIKFRYQGGAPYTPFNEEESRANYLSQGQGIFDYSRLNSLRLNGFNGSDIRIDKKWNLKKVTIDLFLDITNWYAAKSTAVPSYTFQRTTDNTAFETTDGSPIKSNGSNAIPLLLKNDEAQFTPTIGFIVEF
ncbi:TonB-dependent receptor [Pedobacter psychrodurus]|uniref:TonB-dependent receptor n=1 Tax=Pedobacter psychrodurus TaxID=2530456 RepID=A0A4R0Q279_9SPHI|nr:TonB-dependent receptor [Pedobacter psychrodurus]TCD28333.1 TonB-dependent receptor [Pedobacter psychrodurus]